MRTPEIGCPEAAGVAAFLLGLASAAVSAYWLAGGAALLDTIGGALERWGRERSSGVLLALTALVLVKLFVAVIPLMTVSLDRLGRWFRRVAWISAAVLVIYGGLLTAVGLLVQADVVQTSAEADTKALAWHAFLWDPWFLLWGLALALHLRRSAGGEDASRVPIGT